MDSCIHCNGTGVVKCNYCFGDGSLCTHCHGTGTQICTCSSMKYKHLHSKPEGKYKIVCRHCGHEKILSNEDLSLMSRDFGVRLPLKDRDIERLKCKHCDRNGDCFVETIR